MSLLDNTNKDGVVGANSGSNRKIWCDEDRHGLFEFFTDFNDWLDDDEVREIREKYGIDGLTQPNKAFMHVVRSV